MELFAAMQFHFFWNQFAGEAWSSLTPLEPQSRFGDTLLEVWVVCPQNGTAVLKGLSEEPQKKMGWTSIVERLFLLTIFGPIELWPPVIPHRLTIPYVPSDSTGTYIAGNRGVIVNRTYGTHKNLYTSLIFHLQYLVLFTMVLRNILYRCVAQKYSVGPANKKGLYRGNLTKRWYRAVKPPTSFRSTTGYYFVYLGGRI